MLFRKQDPLVWKKRFAYIPTIVGINQDNTFVRLWWKPYEYRRRTDLDNPNENFFDVFERRMIDPPRPLGAMQFYTEHFEGYRFSYYQQI